MKKVISLSCQVLFDVYPFSLKRRFLCCGIILIFLAQFAALKTAAVVNEENFDDRNFETLAGEPDIRDLKPGETLERQAQATDVHVYRINLEAGTSVVISFGKRDVSIQLTALTPDSRDLIVAGQKIPAEKELGRVIADGRDYLVEPFVLVADDAGNYFLTARFLDSGSYTISCSEPHPTTENDRQYAAAAKLFAQIRQAAEAGTPLGKVRDKAEQRAEIYRRLNDKISLALSLNDVGRIFQANAEYGNALKNYKEALEIFRTLNRPPMVMDTLFLVGSVSSKMRDYQTAIDSYTELLSLSRSLNNKSEEGLALHQLGVIYHLLADEQKAREFYEQSLAVERSITPPTVRSLSAEATTLTNIGNLYRGMSYGEIPIEFFSARTAEDRQKAIGYYKQAIEIWKKVTQLSPNARTLQLFNTQQIGNTYKELGDYPEALSYLNQALEGAQKTNSKPGQINNFISIGNLYVLKGEYQKGFEYFEQALTLLRAGGYNANQVEYLNNIARDYYRAGETQKALDIYNESLALSKAREQQEAASASLYEIARIERDLGNFSNARNRIEEAIQIAESMRAAIRAQEVRTTYFSTVKRYYDFYIDLLMQAHKSQPEKRFDMLALQMSEKARSRTLLDLLTFSRIDIKQGIDPQLLARETQAREKLLERANQQNRLLLGKPSREETEKLKNEVAALTDEYQSIQAEIKNKSPRYAALTQPTPLKTEQIQQLLDSGTILLEYSLGEQKSYLWAVSANSVAVFDLPGRAEIEAQVRRFYEILTARNLNLQVESDAQRRARIKAAEEEYPKVAAQLSRMLFGSAASQIGNKRLLIVPDGALNYIPFSALPLLKESEAVSQWQPLGINHEIITLPSASILALLRNETVNRKPAPKMLAVFADPVFDQNDLRSNVAGGRKNGKSSKANNQTGAVNGRPESLSANRDFDRAVSDLGLVSRESRGLPRLPFSRREANSIFNVSPKNLSLKEVDFEASKANVFKSNLEQYRILHFATHGLLNSQHPELSGIVLSLVDKNGGEIDGFLRLQDIYNLKLSADLVVLSACQTALGKDIKGEGLISLTRGFMYAGAKSVVASLWKVDDAATAELMTIFYRKMLVENLRPAAALRAAQAEMMKQARWKSPYYWAGFIIQGDWR